jgi:hypothetical protein
MEPLGVNEVKNLLETRPLVAKINRWEFHGALPPVADAPGSPRAPPIGIIEIWGQNGTQFANVSEFSGSYGVEAGPPTLTLPHQWGEGKEGGQTANGKPIDVVLGYRRSRLIRRLAQRSGGRLRVVDSASAYFRLQPAELDPAGLYACLKDLLRLPARSV